MTRMQDKIETQLIKIVEIINAQLAKKKIKKVYELVKSAQFSNVCDLYLQPKDELRKLYRFHCEFQADICSIKFYSVGSMERTKEDSWHYISYNKPDYNSKMDALLAAFQQTVERIVGLV